MDIVVKALVLVAIVATGFGIKRLGWVRASDFTVLATIALRVTLPCALAVSFDSFDLTPSLALLPVVAFALNLVLMGCGSWLGAHTPGGRAFGVLNVPSFNIGLFAVPYVAALVGPDAIVYAAMFDVGNALAAAGIGYGWGIALACGDRITAGSLARTTFTSPLLVPYVVLVLLRAFDLHLPGPVLQFAQVVGGANTFVAMLMIGVGLELVLPRQKYATAAVLLGARYVVAVLFAAAVWCVPGLEAPVRLVLGLLVFAPIAAMASAFTAEAGLDVETATFMSSASILVGLAAMPAALSLFTALSG